MCASPGNNCAAVGDYIDGESNSQGFVAVEKNGVWGKATDVAVGGRIAGANSVACASPGNCAAAGYYTDRRGHRRAFVVSKAR